VFEKCVTFVTFPWGTSPWLIGININGALGKWPPDWLLATGVVRLEQDALCFSDEVTRIQRGTRKI
jgi:hypothetical protein